MATTWIRLLVPAFGQPAGAVLAVDAADGRLAQLLNADLAIPAADPGGSPPAVPAPNAGGDMATDAELAAALGGGAAAPTTDTAREGYVPARLSDASLKAAYVPPTARGARLVWLGDSITQAATDNANQSLGQSYPLMAQLQLGGKGMTVRNSGVAGNTSAQMLARFDTDVTPYAPNVVPLLAGTNDIGNGVALATFQANIAAIVGKIRALGATAVLCTIPPNNDTSRAPAIALWNVWLTRYAAGIGAPLIDLHKVLTDAATGVYKSGYTSDGTHPTASAQQLMGQAAASVLSTFLNPWSVPLVQSPLDTVQILGNNPLLTADSNSDGIPDTWDAYGDNNATHALTTDSQVMGKMAQVTVTGSTGIRVLERPISSGFAPGDKLAWSGIITSDGGVNVDLGAAFDVGGSAFPARFQGAVTRGIYYTEFIVPAGCAQMWFQLVLGAGTGMAAIGQPSVYNLTALGLA